MGNVISSLLTTLTALLIVLLSLYGFSKLVEADYLKVMIVFFCLFFCAVLYPKIKEL